MGNATSFKKGQSGNPGGRPAIVRDIQELAQERCEAAIKRLDEIASDPKVPAQARVAANNALLDRGIGKPIQTIDQTVREHRYVARLPEKAKTPEEWLAESAAYSDPAISVPAAEALAALRAEKAH